MTVIIKANELNTLIYKYFLEAGLTHSAYTLFNEAALAQPLQQLRFDIKPAHLLSLLQKSLIYSQIQAHCSFSEYKQCLEPFHLLKAHTCKIVDRVFKEREETQRELEEQLNNGIKRTNSIFNAAITNKDFEDIVYEAKGKKYFEKFAKIRLPANDNETEKSSRFMLGGTQTHTILYNPDDYEIDLLKYDNINEQISIERIFPCVRKGELARSISEGIANQHLIQLYQDNHVTLFDLRQEELIPIEFNLLQVQLMKHIQPNPNIPQLVAFKNQEYFCVVNINTFKVVKKGQGEFYWRNFDQYILLNDGETKVHSLVQQNSILTFQGNIKWQEIHLNASKTLFAAVSYIARTIHIFTFENPKPLFEFKFQDTLLRQALMVTSNSVDYLCWFTNDQIKVFDISLNSYSKIIELNEYDSQLRQICALRKADKEQLYLLGLGSQNLLIYDISNSKMERVQTGDHVEQLKSLSSSHVAMITESNIYFLVSQYMDALFT